MRPTEDEIRKVYDQGPDAVVALFNKLFDLAETLDERIKSLENAAGTTSKNSSKPPSQDPFRNTNKKKSKRKQRRATRHHSGGRKLLPLMAGDKIIDLRAPSCGCCGLPLSPHSQHVGEAGRYQQVEIPEVKRELTEWRRHALRCGGCGGVTKAAVPAEAMERFGPRLESAVTALSGDKRQTTRQLKQLMSDFYGVEISTGQINNIVQRVGALCQPAADALHSQILEEEAIYGDETSWRMTGIDGVNRRAWLWGVFSRRAAYYEIKPTRGSIVAEFLIPVGYEGVVHTDCYAGYNHIAASRRQVCWAHLKRHFQKHAERDGPTGEWGTLGLAICERVFKLSKHSTEKQRELLIADTDALIEAGLTHDGTRTMATTLTKHRGSLWHCLYREDVDATNNHAERMIRPAVIKRKLSLGSGSAAGAKATAALLSVVTTARMRGLSPYAFIESTVRAARAGKLAPQMA